MKIVNIQKKVSDHLQLNVGEKEKGGRELSEVVGGKKFKLKLEEVRSGS